MIIHLHFQANTPVMQDGVEKCPVVKGSSLFCPCLRSQLMHFRTHGSIEPNSHYVQKIPVIAFANIHFARMSAKYGSYIFLQIFSNVQAFHRVIARTGGNDAQSYPRTALHQAV